MYVYEGIMLSEEPLLKNHNNNTLDVKLST